ncbi:facilitated trehalose transporter Tret1-like [Rhodnius prolixus]|uniref:facilitated trehalose transporter Tret1-like n=1 Tax=Rhodnius prolixus TaxID=13249 RepID=UPI003D18D309
MTSYHQLATLLRKSSSLIPPVVKCNKNVINQVLASSVCNINVLVAYSGFTFLEPLTVWLTSEESEIRMTSKDVSWLSASIELGELIIGIPSGYFADLWGRKPLLLSIAPIGLITYLLAMFTRNIPALYVVRVLQGINLGISMTVTPTYIAEISSPELRGALGGFTIVSIYLGFLFSYSTGHYLNYRNYIYCMAALPVILFLTYLFVPESPYYYFMKEKEMKAVNALVWLRGGRKDTRVIREAIDIQKAVRRDMKRKSNWKDLMATKSDRRAMLIVQAVNIATYMTGVQSVAMYAGQTFMTTSLLWINSSDLTILMSLVLAGSAFVAAFVTDTIGRRKLLLFSSVGIAISNVVISVYYYLAENTTVFKGITWSPSILYYGIFGLCVTTNIGVGELVHTLQGEYFPSHTRSLAGGVTSAIGAVAIFISVKLYQPFIDHFGVFANFIMYTLIAIVTFVIILIYMTESSCKTLAQVNADIREAVHEVVVDVDVD